MTMQISFPGGLAVDATYRARTIHTDQPVEEGGRGTALSPFDLFLVSIGTCAGFYVLRFFQERGIETAGLSLTLETERQEGSKHLAAVRLEIGLPPQFPEKYRTAVVRAAEHCTVKRHLEEPPRIEVTAVDGSSAALVPAAASHAI